MIGEKKLQQIAQKTLFLTNADEAEVVLFVTNRGLTRFANSQIHQNVSLEDLGLSVRVVFGKRIGVASGNSFQGVVLQNVVNRAEAIAGLQKEDPHFRGLPEARKLTKIKSVVIQATGQERAQNVSAIIKKAKEQNVIASGAYDSSVTEVAVANSKGVWAYHVAGASDLSTILMGENSTGFGSQLVKNPADMKADAVADRALSKVLRGQNPKEITPGEYDVILEPQAVNEMMSFFAWLGPNARLYYEEASPFSGKLGETILGENITIVDNPMDEAGFPMPFDFEGHPKEKLVIVEKGKLANLTYDSYHAGRFNARNTGHALPAPNTSGPIPLHLAFDPGAKSLEEMIKGVKRGLLVTRLWYVRFLNPRSLSITGMTRDGTFLIENGEIVSGVRNLRFNQSIPEALNSVVEIGRDLEPAASFETELGTNRMPALHIKNWNFTSGTQF
ncbi:MAG: TldD/PmbA family protein [Candidatus Blackburnbacteria bacterium]|nr:TldD/PmbA family protein [Candidatus Blackburnbacteria bacterium]